MYRDDFQESTDDIRARIQSRFPHTTFSMDDFMSHVLVIGTSGKGKTRACLDLIKSIQNKIQGKTGE